MNDLDFVKSSLGCIDEAFKEFKDSYNTLKFGFRKPISHWHGCANRMEEILEKKLLVKLLDLINQKNTMLVN